MVARSALTSSRVATAFHAAVSWPPLPSGPRRRGRQLVIWQSASEQTDRTRFKKMSAANSGWGPQAALTK
jgi:hypothetical protein